MIALKPDLNIQPGHQWLAVPNDPTGWALATLLCGEWQLPSADETLETILIPHNATVDRAIVKLIDELAHVRFSAPDLVQMTLLEVPE
jgi:hypothetical protein